MLKNARSKSGFVGYNENGKRCGETHHRAKLSDDDVELILYLHTSGLSFRSIAAKWDLDVTISQSTIRNICRGRSRATMPVEWRLPGQRRKTR